MFKFVMSIGFREIQLQKEFQTRATLPFIKYVEEVTEPQNFYLTSEFFIRKRSKSNCNISVKMNFSIAAKVKINLKNRAIRVPI